MKKKLFDLTIEEFVRLLCNKEEIYTLNLKAYPSKDGEETQIKGTYSQIYDVFMNLATTHLDSAMAQDCLNQIKSSLFDYDMELSELDIFDYLEKKTNCFQKERCEIILNQLEMYHCLYVNEERLDYVNKKIENGWDEYKIIEKVDPIGGKTYKIIDYKDAYQKIYGCAYDFFYWQAICLLKDKIRHEEKKNDTENTDIKALPEKLDTEKSKTLFQKIIDLKYCISDGNVYKWTGSPSLFGYFVDVASDFLNVRPSNNRLPWKIFKIAFQCSDTDISTAKQAVNDYRNKGLSEPEGFLDIKKLCK